MYTKISALILSFLIALCLLSTSCSTDKYNKQISQIDSLNAVLDSALKKLNTLDTTVVQSHFKEYSKNIKIIRENFKEKDNNEIWTVLTRYGMLKKPLRDFTNHYVKYSKQISFSRKQLSNLKADIKDNAVAKDKVLQYIGEEASFVNYIKISVSDLIENTQNYNNQFLELNPKVEKYFQNAKPSNVIDNNIDDD